MALTERSGDGKYGTAPAGADRLVIGHESVGRVLDAPLASGLAVGDLVVGIVRRPDPVPCPHCAIDEWDMCSNGRYTERGIKDRHGYASERFRIEAEFVVRIDDALGLLGVLVEPTSVVAKAWDHIERIGSRSPAWSPRSVLICGAGPIGLLAAMLGAAKGHDIHVVDQVTDGPKPGLVADLGARYHVGDIGRLAATADVVIECTGVPGVVVDVLTNTGADSIVCLTGVSSGGRSLPFDVGAVNRGMVLGNAVVFGTVNASRRHYESAVTACWPPPTRPGSVVSSPVAPVLDVFAEAFERRTADVKTIVTFTR